MTISTLMMLLSLAVQGAYFWARDAASPNPPAQFLISDIAWLIALCSLIVYKRHPYVTIACSWGLLLTVSIILWRFYFSHSFASLLLMNSAAATNVFFAHAGVRVRRARMGHAAPK